MQRHDHTETVALTFDDGPSEWTPDILDILAEHQARATFFVIGSFAEMRPDVIERMIAEGHEVGNHSWSHPVLADCDDPTIRRELAATNGTIERIAGTPPTRFRAPRYRVDDRVLAIAAELGLRHTPGTVTPPDWKVQCSAQFITTFVLQQIRPHGIIGLHDGIPAVERRAGSSQQRTVDALARFVPLLTERGYRCVGASTLLDDGAW